VTGSRDWKERDAAMRRRERQLAKEARKAAKQRRRDAKRVVKPPLPDCCCLGSALPRSRA
jgi:hypothetical protein